MGSICQLHQRLGDDGLRELISSPQEGLAALEGVLRQPAEALLADFAAACWIDDPELAEGRLSFRSLDPPRPPPLIRLAALRPTSGQAALGVGGFAQLIVSVGQERPLPLALRGDPTARWARVVLVLRQGGADEAVRLDFDEAGLGRLDLSALRAGDSAVVSVTARPVDDAGLDRRRLSFQWGLNLPGSIVAGFPRIPGGAVAGEDRGEGAVHRPDRHEALPNILNPLGNRFVSTEDLELYKKYSEELPGDRERLLEIESRLSSGVN